MPERWITRGALAVGLLALAGCQSWCERHYPCPQQACCPSGFAPAPVAAVPSGFAPAPVAIAPATTYQQRVPTCTCQVPQ